MRKHSLCIGINDYENFKKLSNCENDAYDLSETLTKFGFESKLLLNPTQDEIIDEIRTFKEKISNDDISLIFFAGHGLKVETSNFLVPKNAEIKFVEEIPYKCINADDFFISNDPANKNLHIIILDACRDNPFSSGINSRGIEIGLNKMSAPLGTLISFATSPGTKSWENTGDRNSYFTKALLEEIQKPNLTIEEIFRKTRTKVIEFSEGKQVPWEESSLHGDNFSFYTVHPIDIELDEIVNRWKNLKEPIELAEIQQLFDKNKVQHITGLEKLQLLFTLFDIGFERERLEIVSKTIDQDYYLNQRVDEIFPILHNFIIQEPVKITEKLNLGEIEITDEINYGFNFIETPDECFPQIMSNHVLIKNQPYLLSVFVTSNGASHIANPILFKKDCDLFTFQNYGVLVGSDAELFLEEYFKMREHLENNSRELQNFKWD
ncbi:hypothetical protein CMU11_08310 [Elizabethkingia anophelis]|nr:caspase family protein [Elizabethkingia anophelis]MDV3737109.1 hypothetical protein [Elizabethkingia anophelis]MDV3946404.1 hypothetical protein [Elizabethkingia anophelis]